MNLTNARPFYNIKFTMFIFIRLLFGHFIGDYLLQFRKVYTLKFRGLKGVIPHVLLVVASLTLLSWPYLKLPGMWGFLIFIGITHLFQDWIKANLIKIKDNLWVYLLDQILHALAISAIFLTGLKDLKPPSGEANVLVRLYNNDAAIIFGIAIIFATYNGFYMISNFRKTYLGSKYNDTAFEKWYGMLERLAIVSLFFIGDLAILFVPLVLCMRLLVFALGKRKFAIHALIF